MDKVQSDYLKLLSAIRSRKAKCADCARPIQESVTGVKHRNSESGQDSICDACFYQELGERLQSDMPNMTALAV
jgi:hypothetical protein